MELYHASTLEIKKPVIMNRFKTLDFGTGFYTTLNEEQAKDFALKTYRRRGRQGLPTVNRYEFDEEQAKEALRILVFSQPDASWLEFVVDNRRHGRSADCKADVIIGPVANDDVFEAVALYETGQIDEETAIKRFKVKELFNQVLFCNETALGYLVFKDSYVLEVSS